MSRSGPRAFSQAPIAVPSALPVPAATATRPSEVAGAQPAQRVLAQQEGQEERQEAGERAQAGVGLQAVQHRRADRPQPGPPLGEHRARRLVRGTPAGPGPRPWPSRPCAAARTTGSVPVTNTTKAPYSGQLGPIRCSPPPIGAASPVASSPASVTRELALTSEIRGGSSRGTTALLTTPYALDDTSTPSAAGYSSRPPVGHRARHRQRQQRAGQHRAGHRRPAAVRHPVQQRADDRREQRERRHGDRQIQRHPAPRLVRRHREEHRRGQRDGDHHVARGVHRVQLDQLAQTRLARAVRMGGAPYAARRARERSVQGTADDPARPASPVAFSRPWSMRATPVTSHPRHLRHLRRPCGSHHAILPQLAQEMALSPRLPRGARRPPAAVGDNWRSRRGVVHH